MSLSSPEYFVFLVIAFFIYWLIWRARFGALGLILLANFFFYAKWALLYLALVPASATIDFFLARAIDRTPDSKIRKLLVACSVILNTSLIVLGKYIPFLFGGVIHHSFVLPLGLSFYAFQAMTYTLDIYRQDASPTKSYWTYLASVSFFPTTLAGPITRVSSLISQWEKRKTRLTTEEGSKALFLIASGLFKKFLIADYLANNLVNRVFDLPNLYSGGEVLVAVYAYAFQLYYDFSGYSDIAIGSALLLGFKLPANFNRPYLSENLTEFWRRWHISLSNWLRDYLYFSLPGLRSKWKIFAYLNLVITMTIGGLWHGPNWTFLIWGLLHGIGLAILRLFETMRGKTRSQLFAARLIRRFTTFQFVCLCWVFFRAADLKTAGQILTQIGSLHFAFDNVSLGLWLVLAIAALIHFTPKEWLHSVDRWFCAAPAFVQAAAMLAVIFAIQYVGATGAAPFVYTKF